MSTSAAAIRAGQAYVELTTRDSMLKGGLVKAEQDLKAFGQRIQQMGQKLFAGGAAAVAPFGLSVKSFAGYEEQLSKLKASANPTAEEMTKLKGAIDSVSRDAKTGPTQVAAGFTEMLKAGMSVEQVMGSTSGQLLKFAKVAEMDVTEAVTVANDAMNVFGEGAEAATDIISKAADSSSISVKDVADSFKMTSAVAGLAEQKMGDVANAIAIMGQNGVKGSDAGTSLKQMFLNLMAPATEGQKVMDQYGLSFRDAGGKMLPLRGIIAELQSKLGGLSDEARDAAMRDLLGADAIRAGAVLMKEGVAGWDEFAAKVGGAMTVQQKFDTITDNLSGRLSALWAAVERAGNAVGETLAPAFGTLVGGLSAAAEWVAAVAVACPGLVQVLGVAAAAVAALGAAMMAGGLASKVFGGTIGNVVSAVTNLPGALTTVGAHFLLWKERIASVVSKFGALKLAMAGLGVAVLATGMFMAADALGMFGKKAEEAAVQQMRLNGVIAAGRALVDAGFEKRMGDVAGDPDALRAELEFQKGLLERKQQQNIGDDQRRMHLERTGGGMFGWINGGSAAAAGEAEMLAEYVRQGKEEEERLRQKVEQVEQALKAIESAARGANGELAESEEQTKAWEKAVEQAEGRIEDLQDEVDVLAGRATKADVELRRMARDAMPQDVIDRTRELLAEQERLNKAKQEQEKVEEKIKQHWEEARDRAKQITDANKTPAERRREELAELERMRRTMVFDEATGGFKSLISEETFQRGKSDLERQGTADELQRLQKLRDGLAGGLGGGSLAGVSATSAEGLNLFAAAQRGFRTKDAENLDELKRLNVQIATLTRKQDDLERAIRESSPEVAPIGQARGARRPNPLNRRNPLGPVGGA